MASILDLQRVERVQAFNFIDDEDPFNSSCSICRDTSCHSLMSLYPDSRGE